MEWKLIIFKVLIFLSYIVCYKPVVLIHGIMTGCGSMEMIKYRIEEVWFDRKHLAKKAAADFRRSASATGGGPSAAPQLSQWELKVLAIMGDGFGSHQTEARVPAFYEKHPGTIIYNINRFESWSSLETMWHQVLEIGQDVANFSSRHPGGINIVGYSQGGLIARGIVETFPNISVDTFISLSSPQGGQYGAGFLHLVFPGLLKDSAYELFYSRVGQHTSVGNYWNDPYHQNLYQSYSVYLPYINNHIESVKSDEFKENLLKLKRLVLIGGPDDDVITPWQSSQFGYYMLNETVIEMRELDIYKDDKIGLRTLDESGRLHVITVPGVNHFNWHMNVTIVDNYLLPYLD